jgi:uncharacterized protein
MPLTLDENTAKYQIRAFKPGYIQVNEEIYTTSLIISPTTLVTNWSPQTITDLKREHFDAIIPLHPAILLIGTGTTLSFPPVEIYGELINQGIGVEIMDTSAACRTYNALTAEERNVIAALIIR